MGYYFSVYFFITCKNKVARLYIVKYILIFGKVRENMIIKHIFHIVFLVLALVFLFACGNKEERHVIPVEDFIFKSEKSHFKLSPSGNKIAYLGMDSHCKNIFISDLEDEDHSKQLTYQADLNVQSFYWVNDELILFSNAQNPGDSLKLFTVQVDDESIQPVMKSAKGKIRFVQPIQEYNGAIYASMNVRDSAVFDLYKIYLDGRNPQLVYQNPGNITSWIASHDGVVRLALTSDSAQESILYRAHESDQFREIVNNDFKTTILPLGYKDSSLTNVIAMSNENRDKLAVVEYNVAEGMEVEEIFKSKDVDVDREGYSPDQNRLLYVSTSVCKKEYHFFDDRLSDVYAKLADRFDAYAIDFVDMDQSLDNFIVQAYSDVHPGELYHYDFQNDTYNLLSTAYPQLDNIELLPMKHVTFNARDDKEIHGYVTYPKEKKKNYPLVVLVHDGPSRRDNWGFQPEVQFLANRGYAVFQVNYRGTRGYGKEFWSAGFKEWGGRIQSDITDGVTWLIHEGTVDKNRIAIMGTGFGGYAALHAACFNPSFYRCAISSSGYSNLFTYFREIPPHLKPYVQMYYQIVGNPEAETEFFKAISPVFHADKVKKPVLYFQGGKDRFTSVTDANQFVAKLKQNNVPVRYVFKEDEWRRFRQEENLMQYYQEIESFLAQHLK